MNSRFFGGVVLLLIAVSIIGGAAVLVNNRWRGPKATSERLAGADSRVAINEPVPNVIFTDLDGHRHRLADARGKVVVLLVQGNRCSCSKAYVDRVNPISQDYAPRGMELWAFNPQANETEEETCAYARENKVRYTLAYDTGGAMAGALNAACTTKTWVEDRDGVLRCHGRIDDNTNVPDKVKQRDLRVALDAVLGGRPVPNPDQPA